MLPKPSGGRSVAVFTGHAFGDVKFAAFLFGGNRKGVTGKASRGTGGGFQPHDLGHALGNRPLQNFIGLGVLILEHPGAVFVLEDAAVRHGTDTPVAGRRAARSRTHVLPSRGTWLLLRHPNGYAANKYECR